MNIYSYGNKKALLAYIDLLGTRLVYEEMHMTLEKQAERLYMSLLAIFSTEFQNTFSEQEIRENFYVNIYADSIMICSKIDTKDIIEKLIKFLLKFQWNLIFEAIPDNNPIPSRALIDRQPFFSIRIESPEVNSILNCESTTCSLCGGKGMVSMDKELKGLPVGVYISENIKDNLRIELLERVAFVKGEQLYFFRQEDGDIDFLFLPLVQSSICSPIKGKTLNEIMERLFPDSLPFDIRVRVWKQWIDIHERKADEILRYGSGH